MKPCVLLQDFLCAKLAANLAERSIRQYRAQITTYLDWLAQKRLLSRWDLPSTVEAFLAHERARGLAPKTLQMRHRALSVWFNWLTRRGYFSVSPMASIDAPRLPKRRMRYVSLAQYRQLADGMAGDTWVDLRDRAMLMLMFFSGLRVSETTSLNVDSIDWERRLVTVRGKGDKMRLAPCIAELLPLLRAYLDARPEARGRALFLSSDGMLGVKGRISTSGVRKMLIRRCAAAGLPAINPHAFRHGFAMLFLNSGMTLSAVGEVMGHSNEQTTRGYAYWLSTDLSRAYDAVVTRFGGQGG